MALVPPEQVFSPDIHPENLYLAVGRAITEWEKAEFGLAWLYSIFKGLPGGIELLIQYGAEGNSFLTRMNFLRNAAKVYFIERPSQALEAELDAIIAEATELSRERHKIAHGIVAPHWRPKEDKRLEGLGAWLTYYSVIPPWYQAKNLIKHDKTPEPYVGYNYRVADVDERAAKFVALRERAFRLHQTLDPPNTG